MRNWRWQRRGLYGPHPHPQPLSLRERGDLLPPLQGEGWGGDGVKASPPEQRRIRMPREHDAWPALLDQARVSTEASNEDQFLAAPYERQARALELGHVRILEQPLERLRGPRRMRLEAL